MLLRVHTKSSPQKLRILVKMKNNVMSDLLSYRQQKQCSYVYPVFVCEWQKCPCAVWENVSLVRVDLHQDCVSAKPSGWQEPSRMRTDAAVCLMTTQPMRATRSRYDGIQMQTFFHALLKLAFFIYFKYCFYACKIYLSFNKRSAIFLINQESYLQSAHKKLKIKKLNHCISKFFGKTLAEVLQNIHYNVDKNSLYIC